MKWVYIVFSLLFLINASSAQTEEKKNIDTVYSDDGDLYIVERLSTNIDLIRRLWIGARFGMNGNGFISCINAHYYQPNKFLVNITHCHYSDITPRNRETIDGILSLLKFNKTKKAALPLKYKSSGCDGKTYFYTGYYYLLPMTKSITLGPYTYWGYTNNVQEFDHPIIETSVIGIGMGAIFAKHTKIRYNIKENLTLPPILKKPRIIRGQNISRIVFNVLYYPIVKVYDPYTYPSPSFIGNQSNLFGIGAFIEDKRTLFSISNGNKFGLFSFYSKFGLEYSPGAYFVSNKFKLDISFGVGYNI